jgi:aminoglycoside phosphotransferase family enzyme
MTGLPLEAKVAYLRRPETYPERPTQVDSIETHMSWLFLTDRFVYKLKKPIRYDRLDFTTLSLRRFYCEEEVRLNRRLAETVYRGTVALTREEGGALALNGAGQPVDWLVHMRRLPESRMLDWILARRVVEEDEVRAVALRLAEFYANARRISISTAEFCKRLEEGIHDDRHELSRPEFGLPRERVEAIASNLLAFLAKNTELFEERVRMGRIVEGHGDLRPEHICLTPEPVVIDCLEFCQELREQDPADELAFLALECERLGQPRVGDWFLGAYEERAGDRPSRPLLEFYRTYRILRRAKIAAWHLSEPTTRDRERYAARARRYLEFARPLTV